MVNIASIQTNIFWENPNANKSEYDKLFDSLGPVDLIILPEMFTTGFSMRANEIAEHSSGETLSWMQQHSKKLDSCIVGSLQVKENNKFYNRLYVVKPNEVQYYDKRYLFSMAEEDKHFSRGEKELIFEIKGWKIKPLICYDLRFPVWSRNKYKNKKFDYDILVYIANWPAVRSDAWTSLLKARAIENASYVIGVNRIGEDTNGYQYNGHTTAYDFLGKEIARTKEGKEDLLQCVISKTLQEETRKKLSFLNDKDSFKIQ